jgi:PII-like signaling protein
LHHVIRLEIVVDAVHSAQVIDILVGSGLKGYTLIRGVSGAGERGRQHGDDITGVSSNNYILTTCNPEALDALTNVLRPLLKRVGGICLVSDARWLGH